MSSSSSSSSSSNKKMELDADDLTGVTMDKIAKLKDIESITLHRPSPFLMRLDIIAMSLLMACWAALFFNVLQDIAFEFNVAIWIVFNIVPGVLFFLFANWSVWFRCVTQFQTVIYST